MNKQTYIVKSNLMYKKCLDILQKESIDYNHFSLNLIYFSLPFIHIVNSKLPLCLKYQKQRDLCREAIKEAACPIIK